MNKYVELLKNFQEWNPEIVDMMRNCSHHFDSNNLNPYHAEGDVWSHTMMMYRDFLSNINTINDMFYCIVNQYYHFPDDKVDDLMDFLAISILCHDIGKVYNRAVPNGQYGKIAFYSHSFSSVQPTIDFISFLKNNKGIDFSYYIGSILNVISNHMDYFSLGERDRILLADNDIITFAIGEYLNAFDIRNSIDSDMQFSIFPLPKDSIIDNIDYMEFKDFMVNPESKVYDIIVYCGCPGSGKDYIAEMNNDIIHSFDQIRLNKYIEDGNSYLYKSNHELYNDAFVYCNENNINLMSILNDGIKDDLENDNIFIPAICNTSLTRKSRRSIASHFNKYSIKIVYVVAPSHILHYRNENRSSKKLDKLIMNRFMYNQQVPTMFDFKNTKNVVKIEVLYNE